MSYRHLILGLLTEQPMSGYDIKKRVQAALGAVTNASYGTLYPVLHKLLEEGAVEVREVPQKTRPLKKVYQITGMGRQEILDWLAQPLNEDQIQREFLIKLYLAARLAPEQLIALVTAQRSQQEARCRALRADKDAADDLGQVWMIGYALSLCQAEIDWLEQIEHQIDT